MGEGGLEAVTPGQASVAEAGGEQNRVLFWASATHFLNDGLSAAVTLLLPFIAADLALSYGEAGVVKAALNGLISLTQLPAGVVAGKTGEAILLAIGLGWFSISFLLVGLSASYAVLLVLMASAGAGGGVYHPVGTAWVSRVFLGGRRGTAVGTLNFAGDLGKVAMPALAGYLVLWAGWRGSLVLLGAAGTVLAVTLAVLRQARAPGRAGEGIEPGRLRQGLGDRPPGPVLGDLSDRVHRSGQPDGRDRLPGIPAPRPRGAGGSPGLAGGHHLRGRGLWQVRMRLAG